MEKMKEEGPFDVLKEMMRIHFTNPDVGEVSNKHRMIDRDLDTIFDAFRKLEQWKKEQEAECERLIRLLTTHLDSSRLMFLVHRIQPTLGRIRAAMQNYLPVIFNYNGGGMPSGRADNTDSECWTLKLAMNWRSYHPRSASSSSWPTLTSPSAPSSAASPSPAIFFWRTVIHLICGQLKKFVFLYICLDLSDSKQAPKN